MWSHILGGASVALFLLMEGFVSRITINDKDRAIYAFWHSVLNKTTQLCKMIEDAELTVQEWQRQKKIQNGKQDADLLELGFSTFYLNRTNRSGIINAGLIGGIHQTGNYLMDCRFNKVDLINRIKLIAKNKKQIRLYKKDAIKLMDKIQEESKDENIIFYFDPPYYLKASTLYMNHYQDESHKKVSDKIKAIKNIQWIVSYDNVPEIKKLYQECSSKEFSFMHTAYKSRIGKEILFFSPKLKQPIIKDWNPLQFKLDRKSEKYQDIFYKQRKNKENMAI